MLHKLIEFDILTNNQENAYSIMEQLINNSP